MWFHYAKTIRIVALLIFAIISLKELKNYAESNTTETKTDYFMTLLDEIDPPFPAILIDLQILQERRRIRCGQMDERIKIAVHMQHKDRIEKRSFLKYDIVYYEEPHNKNYILFHGMEDRAIPRLNFYNHRNLSIPANTVHFLEFWNRSRLITCLGLDVRHPKQVSYLPVKKTVETLTFLVAYLVSYDIYPFLICGTLLGWFRECDIIPHTKDIDIAAFIEQYNPELLKHLESRNTEFIIKRRLGTVNDSFEFTLRPMDNGDPSIDLFWMYSSGNESWIGGLAESGRKYKWIYPRITSICAGILLDHLFWVPCDPVSILKSDYGPTWHKDHQTKNFYSDSSPYNVRSNGQYSPLEMKEVYKVY